MKPQIALNPSEMEELESLGLDCSDAGMMWVGHGKEDKRPLLMCLENRDAGLFQQLKRIPAYTLEDILMKLPGDNVVGDDFYLTLTKDDKYWIAYEDCWLCTPVQFDSSSPLMVAFKMLKHVIKNHPDKIKRL